MSNLVQHPKLDDFTEVVLLDTEFIEVEGERVVPVALVARELRSGTMHRIFFEGGHASAENPFPEANGVLYVAYAAQAEWKTFIALQWDLPLMVIDLFAEFRCLTNGLANPDGTPLSASLVSALNRYGLPCMSALDKQAMRQIILRGHPYSQQEQVGILDYCGEDVNALESLLVAMIDQIDVPHCFFRGRYTLAVARIEDCGVPVDRKMLALLKEDWTSLKRGLVARIEQEQGYGVYQNLSWSNARFEELLRRTGYLEAWPRTPSGLLSTEDETWKVMSTRFPALQPLRDLRSTLLRMNEIKIPVGADGRNRCSIMPFRSITGRNYPPTSKFIFGSPAWLRSLVKPEHGRALAYIDWISAEFGIAAALSGDHEMQAAYLSGDVYMAFAIAAKAAPLNATKDTHPDVRAAYKVVVLAVQYGQGAKGLAGSLGIAEWRAQQLLDLHRRIYKRYWLWLEWVNQRAEFGKRIETVYGWPMHICDQTKATTISNFPMQAHGSEILRWASVFITEQGIEVHAPVQDAFLVGGTSEEIDAVVEKTQAAMEKASRLVLGGFALRSDVVVVRHPDRYQDKRGTAMWDRVTKLLNGTVDGQFFP